MLPWRCQLYRSSQSPFGVPSRGLTSVHRRSVAPVLSELGRLNWFVVRARPPALAFEGEEFTSRAGVLAADKANGGRATGTLREATTSDVARGSDGPQREVRTSPSCEFCQAVA